MRPTTGNQKFGDDLLLRVGVIMMSVALVLTVVAVVVSTVLRGEPERAVASEAEAKKSSIKPLVRTYPSAESSVQKLQPPPKPEPPGLEPQPETEPEPKPELPPASESNWQKPTDEELEAANKPRHYHLPTGAIMALTIRAMGIYNAPVFDSDSQRALANGVAHVPETSLPWSPTPQRNVYLAGHRMGYRGTWSRMIFYNLDKLDRGDEVLLKDRRGKAYRYRVSEVFVAGPAESWVMGQVRGRDMVTLQTCTPISTLDKRLIIRADRV